MSDKAVTNNNFRAAIGFFKLDPRLGRIKYLALTALWNGFLIVGYLFPAIVRMNFIFSFPITCIIIFVCCVNLLLLSIRRLHDFNFSGWWVFLWLIPLIGFIWSFIILCSPGSKGANKYGEQPTKANIFYYLLVLPSPIIFFILYKISTSFAA